MKPEPYVFDTNEWSQERYDQDILFNSEGIHQPEGRHKTNPATEQFNEIKPYLHKKRNAIDIGARWGSFAVQLHKFGFEHVYMAELREKHLKGVSYNVDMSRATMYNIPVMDKSGFVTAVMKEITNRSSGDLRCYSVDDMELDDIDFIKIDVDGPDRLVLQGAKNTIEKCKPVIYIEYGVEQIKWETKQFGVCPSKEYFWQSTLGDTYTAINCLVEDNNLILIPKDEV